MLGYTTFCSQLIRVFNINDIPFRAKHSGSKLVKGGYMQNILSKYILKNYVWPTTLMENMVRKIRFTLLAYE